jgi:molecular chaperone DnaK
MGIDLGTTNCYAAVLEEGQARVIRSADGHKAIPSVVAFPDAEKVLVGHAAQSFAVTGRERSACGVARLLGRKFSTTAVREIARRLPYRIAASGGDRISLVLGDRRVSPEEVCGFLVRELRQMAEGYLDHPITNAVIAVPTYYTSDQKAAVESAARLGGFLVVRLIDQPTAAIFGHSNSTLHRTGTQAVCHFGGGTFDFTVLSIGNLATETVCNAGDGFLGGGDFDARLISLLLTETPLRQYPSFSGDAVGQGRVREAAARAKAELSQSEHAGIDLPHLIKTGDHPLHLKVSLSRVRLEQITADLVARAMDVMRRALENPALDPRRIDHLLLEGGQTRMPAVRRAVAAHFGREPLLHENPEELVACGAVISAVQEYDAEEIALAFDPHGI